MVRETRIVVSTKIWLPRDTSVAYFEITINGVDVKDDCISVERIWPSLRNGLASAKVVLDNPSRKYINYFTKGQVMRIYADYTDGTSLKFYGRIEKPRYGLTQGYRCEIFARQVPALADQRQSVSFDGVPADSAIKSLVSEHYSGVITTTGVSSSMTDLVYGRYQEQSGLAIIQDILTQVNYDGRIEVDNDITTFEDTGVSSAAESINEGVNLISCGYFGGDTKEEKNRIRVYGKKVEEIPLMWTSSDPDSIGATWKRDHIIRDTNLETLDELKIKSVSLKDNLKDVEDKGRVTSIGLSSVKPGLKLRFSVPGCNISGEYYVSENSDSWSPTNSPFWITTCQLNENERTLGDVIIQEKKKRENLSDLENPNNMEKSLIFLKFRNDEEGEEIETLTDCELSQNKLVLSAGKDTGTMISRKYEADANFTKAEIRANINDDCNICEFYASNDNGFSYKQIGIGELGDVITFSSANKNGRLKIIVKSDGNNPKPEVHAVAMFVKT